MINMLGRLDQIEKRLQSLVEGSFIYLFSDANIQHQLAHELVLAMRSNLITASNGQIRAPTQYNIHIHPSRNETWQNNRPLIEDLAKTLYQAGKEAGFVFNAPPVIHLITDPALPPQELRVSASLPKETLGETASISLSETDSTPSVPPNAFLIINGDQNFILRLPVINIGRRSDNHLILTDPRVSRAHAQLRAIKGRYVLFDLGSTGGTAVNGQRINQQTLNPGDVISLSGVPLIYGQDLSIGAINTDTVNLNPPIDTQRPNPPDQASKD
jgi:hypothetical protein